MSVAFHVRFDVSSIEAGCEPGNAWANAVSDPIFKKLISKKKRVGKRIMPVRIKGNDCGIQCPLGWEGIPGEVDPVAIKPGMCGMRHPSPAARALESTGNSIGFDLCLSPI